MAKRRKILIIDDDKDFCDLVKLNLEKTRKFKVLVAIDPAEGIKVAKKESPDLILLDIVMPNMDGTDVLQILSKKKTTKCIPVVFLSGLADKTNVDADTGKIGNRQFIAKPVTSEELIERIEAILEEEDAQSSGKNGGIRDG